MKAIYTMSPAEVDILREGLVDPNYITGYFFRRPGQDVGWLFDNNFDPDSAWQKDVTMTSQSTVVVSGGAGSGKTLGIGMGAVSLGMVIPYFKFLNVAQKAWQAMLMYNLLIEHSQGTPMEDIFYEIPKRPFPKIVIKYRIGKVIHTSTIEFMSADRDATGLLSWRGDWINVEEAGLFDNLDEIITNTSTRLTGSTPLGRPYIARMSLISNPWDVPYFWYLFDMAAADTENSLSLMVSTRTNKNVTDKQIQEMLKKIPKEDHQRFLDGTRPEGKGSYFSKTAIAKCESHSIGEIVRERAEAGIPGYVWQKVSGAGVYHMETKAKPQRTYYVLGDPGSGAAPARNAPVVMVWDTTEFPTKPMMLVGFWWGNGYGAISPFTEKMLDFMGYNGGGYSPIFTGMDSTGPQAGLAEMLNLTYFDNGPAIQDPDDPLKIIATGITPIDFSGSRKNSFLVTLKLMLEAGMILWPTEISGIRSQLANYDPERDRGIYPKLPQDIVATMAMSAFVVRSHYAITLDDISEKGKEANSGDPFADGYRNVRRNPPETRNIRARIREAVSRGR